MATDNVYIIILKGLIHGVLWALLYYYIRKGLNPMNYGKQRQIIEIRQEKGFGSKRDYYGDAIYGGLASVIAYSLDKIVYRLIGI